MAKAATGEPISLWDALPPAERQRIVKHLSDVRNTTPEPKASKKNGQFQLRGYVRCELSASDKEEFKAWESGQEPAAIFAALVKAADSGYLLKVGEQGQGAQASLCASSTGQPWDGMVLVAHAGSSVRAATLLVYKHELMMRGDWSAWLSDEGEDVLR